MEQTMMRTRESRVYPRQNVVKYFKVYTSVTCAAYTVSVENISKNGAFLRSKALPEIGEIITFTALDSMMKPIYEGNAKVVRLDQRYGKEYWGFGVEFDAPFDLSTLEEMI